MEARRRRGVKSALAVVLCALAVLAGPSNVLAQTPPTTASATLLDRNGQMLATAELREQPDQVLIALTFARAGVLTGEHAIHIHERGQCTAPDFADAGSIFNPQRKEHGLLDPAGPMVGDLPDLVLGHDGAARYNVAAPLATLRPGPTSLLNPGGTALVIDDGPDDNRSQPDGNSGARIACGVIVAGSQALSAQVPNAAATSAANDASNPVVESIAVAALGVLLIAGGLLLRGSRTR